MSKPPFDLETFDEWISHTAESRDVSERELINQLISAFWILDELDSVSKDVDILDTDDPPISADETDDDTEPSRKDGGRDHSDAGESRSAPAERLESDEVREVIQTLRQSLDNSSEFSNRFTELQRRIDELEREIRDDRRTQRSGWTGDVEDLRRRIQRLESELDDRAATDATSRADIESVHDRLDELESVHDRLDELESMHDRHAALDEETEAGLTELRGRLEEVESALADHRSTHERHVEHLSNNVTRINGRIDQLESTTEELVEEEALDRVTDRFETELETLQAEQADLNSWIEAEFDSIEALFEHLLDSTEDVQSRLSGLESEIRELEPDVSDRRQLARVRSRAEELGIRSADCDHCDREVDIAMLDSADCPECGRTFTDVKRGSGWNPFASPELVTTPPDHEIPPDGSGNDGLPDSSIER